MMRGGSGYRSQRGRLRCISSIATVIGTVAAKPAPAPEMMLPGVIFLVSLGRMLAICWNVTGGLRSRSARKGLRVSTDVTTTERVTVGRDRTDKRPLDVVEVMRRLRVATKPYPKAAMFELHGEGYSSVFEILVACIISIRTLEEVTLPTARRLFERARTPAQVAKFTVGEIDELIRTCTFHRPKAQQIHDIAAEAVARHGGKLPCDFEALTSFRGVGPKCANLVLGIACDNPHGIGVDIHVHRVTNRWGYVQATTPEKSMAQLH